MQRWYFAIAFSWCNEIEVNRLEHVIQSSRTNVWRALADKTSKKQKHVLFEIVYFYVSIFYNLIFLKRDKQSMYATALVLFKEICNKRFWISYFQPLPLSYEESLETTKNTLLQELLSRIDSKPLDNPCPRPDTTNQLFLNIRTRPTRPRLDWL